MKKIDIEIIESLWKKADSITALSERTGPSISYVSERVKNLTERGLLSKKRVAKKIIVSLNPTFSIYLREIIDKFNIKILFSDKKDTLLLHLLEPKNIEELERETGLSQSQIHKDIRELRQIGAVKKIDRNYSINQGIKELIKIVEFLREKELYRGVEDGAIVLWRRNNEILKKAPKGLKIEGVRTAFSRFSENGIELFLRDDYFYFPEKKLSLEEIFVHSLVIAEGKTRLSMCAVFFLKNRERINPEKLKEYSRKFHVLDLYLDMLSYLETKKGDRFLPWNEFMEKVNLYGIQIKKFDKDILTHILKSIGKNLKRSVDVYLIGGLNLMLRGIKDSTKDIDLVLKNRNDLLKIKNALRGIGYKEETKSAYYGLFPAVVMKKVKSPNFDLFVGTVCGGISLSKDMEREAEFYRKFDKLRVNLLSPEAIFIFKSMTEREGDLEDIKALTLKYSPNWNKILSEVKKQEKVSGRTFSFSLLDTLEILEERYAIHSPVTKKLRYHCIKNGILLALTKPRTINEIKGYVNFPRYMIEKVLSDLENENKIRIDRRKKPYIIKKNTKIAVIGRIQRKEDKIHPSVV